MMRLIPAVPEIRPSELKSTSGRPTIVDAPSISVTVQRPMISSVTTGA